MNNEKTKAVLAYIFGLIGGIVVLIIKDTEQRTKICAAQSITMSLLFYILQFASSFIPFSSILPIGFILNVLYLVAIIVGIVKACGDDNPEIPIIGNLAMSIFKKQIEK